MTALAIGAGAAVLGTGFSIFNGLEQEHKANQIQKNLKQPQYQIPSEFYENRNIARQMAQLGLPQAQYNNQLNQINANQAGAVASASRSANPGAAISNITGQANAATNNLNAEDAQARETNQRFYVDENGQLGNQKLAQQQANVFDPYTQHYNEMQAYRGSGQQNVNTGLQDLSQLGGYALQYGLHPGYTTQPQTFAQQNGTQPLTASGSMTGYTPPPLTNTLAVGNKNPAQSPGFPYYTNWQQFQ